MLIYKQRYKPRTAREFTGTAIDVYDSAGNTALNALTVYGKSEVVDGSIVSAGEGWSTVDLGTLNWNSDNTGFWTGNPGMLIDPNAGNSTVAPLVCAKYPTTPFYTSSGGYFNGNTKAIAFAYKSGQRLYICDPDYTDPADFKSAMSGVLLCYKEATPTNNTIAIKTDNGSGIDGTMATFTTGTPLRGIPDTSVRDVMEWDGSSGEVTKNCGKVRLADLTWRTWTDTAYLNRFAADVDNAFFNRQTQIAICDAYTNSLLSWNLIPDKHFNFGQPVISTNKPAITVYDTDYTIVSDFVASLGDAELIYQLATPTTQALTSTENTSIAALRTFAPQTHAQNNAGTDMTVDYTIRVPTI